MNTETTSPPSGLTSPSCCLSLPAPYYDRDGITIYQGDCRQIMPMLGRFDLLMADPPYGIGADVMQSKRGGKQGGKAMAPSRDYGESNWDAEPVDEWAMMLARTICSKQVIFGGNYYALPPSKCWLVWDKANGENTYADCELAWTSFDRVLKQFRKRSETHGRIHPTQKPVDLYKWTIANFAAPGMRVLDTHLGSGSIAIAAHYAGIHLTACEIDAEYFHAACERIERETSQMDMFAPKHESTQSQPESLLF